ncbi:hypothetical protein SLA2020_390640 [Shorea laevis]
MVPSSAGSFTINFDTAIRDSFSVQAAVCRDTSGRILKAISQVSPPCDPNFGEALAAKLAVTLAISLNLSSFILEVILLWLLWHFNIPSIVKTGK